MFFGDKNRLAAAIVAKQESPAEEKKELAPHMEEMKMIAEEILAAIESKDAAGLAEALASFDEVHDSIEEGEEVEEEEEPSVGEKMMG